MSKDATASGSKLYTVPRLAQRLRVTPVAPPSSGKTQDAGLVPFLVERTPKGAHVRTAELRQSDPFTAPHRLCVLGEFPDRPRAPV